MAISKIASPIFSQAATMPRKTRYAEQPITSVAGRAEFLLREVYHGDQSKMAAETGISQPQISLVVGGKRSAGEKFIAGLSRIPGINIAWLRSGAGGVFNPEQREVPTSGLSLPVYKHLPDSGSGDLGQRSGLHFRFDDLFRPSMYLLEVQRHDPVVSVPELKIASGDMLLMETHIPAWKGNVRSLVGKLVVVRLRGSDQVLARMENSPDTGRPAANIFGTGTVPFARPGGETGAEDEGGQPGYRGTCASDGKLWVDDMKRSPERAQITSPVELASLPRRLLAWPALPIEEVVAVCVLVIRL